MTDTQSGASNTPKMTESGIYYWTGITLRPIKGFDWETVKINELKDKTLTKPPVAILALSSGIDLVPWNAVTRDNKLVIHFKTGSVQTDDTQIENSYIEIVKPLSQGVRAWEFLHTLGFKQEMLEPKAQDEKKGKFHCEKTRAVIQNGIVLQPFSVTHDTNIFFDEGLNEDERQAAMIRFFVSNIFAQKNHKPGTESELVQNASLLFLAHKGNASPEMATYLDQATKDGTVYTIKHDMGQPFTINGEWLNKIQFHKENPEAVLLPPETPANPDSVGDTEEKK